MFGQQMNPMMMRMASNPAPVGGSERAAARLRGASDRPDSDSIEDAVKVLLVVHPKELSEKTQFA